MTPIRNKTFCLQLGLREKSMDLKRFEKIREFEILLKKRILQTSKD
jgi:hypothetical protein